ncbi:hypothetical protein TNCV_3680041 [Trichonephila clavipes]|nr:hypothetical protein TNCV_3680041 [Trichonephila clavipes]
MRFSQRKRDLINLRRCNLAAAKEEVYSSFTTSTSLLCLQRPRKSTWKSIPAKPILNQLRFKKINMPAKSEVCWSNRSGDLVMSD